MTDQQAAPLTAEEMRGALHDLRVVGWSDAFIERMVATAHAAARDRSAPSDGGLRRTMRSVGGVLHMEHDWEPCPEEVVGRCIVTAATATPAPAPADCPHCGRSLDPRPYDANRDEPDAS